MCASWASRLNEASVRALYIHVPFCARKCNYCDFASWACAPSDGLMSSYVDGIVGQIDQFQQIGLLDGAQTAYIGGGTPSFLPTAALEKLVSRVAALGVGELTCEANPDSMSGEKIAVLKAAGATRLSIGVQSLNDAELEKLGRLHNARQAKTAVSQAVASGLDVSCDLMCATPGQTDASWARTLSELAALGVGHVSVYPLAIEEGTPFDKLYGDEDNPWNSDEVQADRMTKAQEVLEGFGFARYEVASYAMPGKQCCHNKFYWTGLGYLGLGTHASSMLTLESYLKLQEANKRLPDVPKGTSRIRLTCTTPRKDIAAGAKSPGLSFDIEALTAPQAAAEDLMLAARLVEGIDPSQLAYARQALGAPAVDRCIDDLLARDLLAKKDGRLRPTRSGWLLGNELYGALWGLAPGEVFSLTA